MYVFESRVRFSEMSQDGRLSLDGLIDYMQDCASFESEELGIGIGTDFAVRRAWVLNFWQIVIDRYPAMGENMTIATQACGSEKMFGYRNFMVKDEAGEYLAKAYSIWTLMDLKKGRPCIVQPEDIEPYGIGDPLPMEPVGRKISVPGEGGEKMPSFFVQAYHLDTYHHVNNVQYIRMATAYLPDGAKVQEVRAEYKRQAVRGDLICPILYEQPGECMVVLTDPEGKIYATVLFFMGDSALM